MFWKEYSRYSAEICRQLDLGLGQKKARIVVRGYYVILIKDTAACIRPVAIRIEKKGQRRLVRIYWTY